MLTLAGQAIAPRIPRLKLPPGYDGDPVWSSATEDHVRDE